MVRTKKAASKKLTAQPMDSPPESPVRQEQQSVVAEAVPRQEPSVAAKPEAQAVYEESEKSTGSVELPLPKEREANQPAITAFFGKSPRKKSETMGKTEMTKEAKSRVVSTEKEKEKKAPEAQTSAPRQPVGEQELKAGTSTTSKMKPRISTRRPPATSTLEKKKQEAEKVPTPTKVTRSSSAMKTRKEAPQSETTLTPQERPEKKPEEKKAKPSKKRKSEVEQLDSPKTESRTRRKVVHKEAEAPTPISTPYLQKEGEELADTQAKAMPPRKKQLARKTRTPKSESAQWYPFISSKAKTAYNDILRGKQPIKERALDLSGADDELRSIITDLGWTKFCAKPDEGALQLVKEFYANLEDMVDDKVFVRGVWVSLTSEEISKIIEVPEFPEDAYSVLMEQGLDTKELERELCHADKAVTWATGKNNQPLNFNTGALQPQWTPLFKFICSRLIPTTHTSHVTVDRATLLYAMINKISVDAGWIIHNNIIDSIGPTKALWFPAIITKLCLQAGVKIEKNEEKVKAGLAISARTSAETPMVGSPRPSLGMQEELKEIKENQKKILSFLEDQHKWNKFMEQKWSKDMGNISDLPTFPGDVSAGTAQEKKKKKADAKASPPPPRMRKKILTSRQKKTTEKEREEEVAAHLGGGDTTGHFTQANLSSDEEKTE